MKTRSIVWTIMIFVMAIVPTVAQVSSCPALVEQALSAIGDNCSDLSRNSACYGFNQVDATFFDEMPADYFTIPSDRAGLNELDSLQTAAMDVAQSRWGVAVLNIQANIPNTIPGQGVMMMLMGDATVENDVNPEAENIIADPLSTVTVTASDVHVSPSTTSAIINTLEPNAIVLVDGYNVTRTWLRVVNDGQIGWIPAENVARLAAMDSLPVISATNPTPMQAFYLSTGIGEVECSEADSMIAVQSPENITVDLTVNGVDIKVGSMITFNSLDASTVNLTVHRGEVATVFGNTISAGESAIGVINSAPEQGDVIVAWGEAVPATDEERALGERAQVAMNNVAQSNGWDEREIDTESEENTTSSGEIIHIVSSGETLFGIGRLYDTSLVGIVNRNGLTEPYTLFSGDELVIPNPGSGFVGLPSRGGETTQPPASSDEPASEFACETLRLTSPLSGASNEAMTYYWDGVAGATQYQINVYDASTGTVKGVFYTNGTETSIVLSAGELGVGGSLQWEVIALANGQPICGTGLSQPMVKGAPVDSTVGTTTDDKPPFSIDWRCDGDELEVTWQNAYPDDTIQIEIYDIYGEVSNRTVRGTSGLTERQSTGYDFIKVKATTSSGEKAEKTGNKDCS